MLLECGNAKENVNNDRKYLMSRWCLSNVWIHFVRFLRFPHESVQNILVSLTRQHLVFFYILSCNSFKLFTTENGLKWNLWCRMTISVSFSYAVRLVWLEKHAQAEEFAAIDGFSENVLCETILLNLSKWSFGGSLVVPLVEMPFCLTDDRWRLQQTTQNFLIKISTIYNGIKCVCVIIIIIIK